MKKIVCLVLILFIFSSYAFAGGSYFYSPSYSTFKYYDSKSKNLFIGVFPGKEKRSGMYKIDRSKFSNILVYNVKTKKQKFLFDENIKLQTYFILFEKEYDAENRKIIFNIRENTYNFDNIVINNENIEKRELNKFIYILTYEKASKMYALWKIERNGENLSEIITFGKDEDLHFDIGNSVIRLISQMGMKTKITEKEY